MRKLLILTFSFLFLSLPQLRADEGMWIPLLLKSIEGDMQANGMKMSAEDIYSVNNSSLKDAIVLFGGGCTGEVISDQGLLLTNHHCGRGAIRARSTLENNYLKDGFWATNQNDEIPNPGLSVTFVIRIEDVTAQVMEGITEGMDERKRQSMISQRSEAIARKAVEGTHYEAYVRDFYYGNEHYLIVTEKFTDIRLVGTPPDELGKFGGDTDNWVWPRHTCDFSMFRIYAGADGKPADYAENNVPFQPRHSFPISLKDKKEGDFTLVFGFPGRTQEYLPSPAVQYIIEKEDPLKIGLRDLRLEVMNREMKKDEAVRLQYASKQSRAANAWKKWQGEVLGLTKTNKLAEKRAYETAFQQRVDANFEWKEKYGNLLSDFEELYKTYGPARTELLYFFEGAMSIEAIEWGNQVSQWIRLLEQDEPDEAKIAEVSENLRQRAEGFFKDYYAPIDREIMAKILGKYQQDFSKNELPDIFKTIDTKFSGSTAAFANDLFAETVFLDPVLFEAALKKPKVKKLVKDPLYVLTQSMLSPYPTRILPRYQAVVGELELLNRQYMKAQLEVFGEEKAFYPDANSTMRITYGKIEGFSPSDGVTYNHYTTLDGLIAKNELGIDDYAMPDRMRELYEAGDYGRYAQDGKLWTCFLASNHTTGGNSGSPTIDAEGNLIGINFDRCWESTMSDISYDVRLCRNISVDIRYVLFIVDKYGEAGALLDEMKLVE